MNKLFENFRSWIQNENQGVPVQKGMIDPFKIEPIESLHHSKQPAMIKIAQDLQQNGWNGRPIAAVQRNDGSFKALTGTHRIFAARTAKLDQIPILFIQEKDIPPNLSLGMLTVGGNYDRTEFLKRFSPEMADLVGQDTKFWPHYAKKPV